jgi:prolyl-tRNA synthetase
VVVRRDTREKLAVGVDTLATQVPALFDAIQRDLFTSAKSMLDQHTATVESYDELTDRVSRNAGWSLAHWCGDAACEARIKAETKATSRCIPFDQPDERGACIVCGRSSGRRVIFARAY